MAAVGTTSGQDHEPGRTAARDRRKADQARELTDLLATRPELAEACPLADLTVQGLRWGV